MAHLYLAQGLDGPEAAIRVTQGDELKLFAPLMFPTVKERDAKKRAKKYGTQLLEVFSYNDTNITEKELDKAADLLPQFMNLEINEGLEGYVSVESRPGGPVICIYMYRGKDCDKEWESWDEERGCSISPEFDKMVKEANVSMVSKEVKTEEDRDILDGVAERIALHCCLHNFRAYFMKLRKPGHGADSGIRAELNEKSKEQQP